MSILLDLDVHDYDVLLRTCEWRWRQLDRSRQRLTPTDQTEVIEQQEDLERVMALLREAK